MLSGKFFVFFTVSLASCLGLLAFSEAKLVQEEVDALEKIALTLGSKYWKFNADTCQIESVGVTQVPPKNAEQRIDCECKNGNNTDCHVTRIQDQTYFVERLTEKYALLRSIVYLMYLTWELKKYNLPGVLPPHLVKLPHLQIVMLSSNHFTGNLPVSFSGLINLTDLRISDINGPTQGFPMLKNMTGIIRLILRNCNIFGELPAYLWTMKSLELLDVSFNKLVGKIPDSISADRLRFIFLTRNLLSGDISDSILKDGSNVDLSYNNFSLQSSDQPICRENMNLNLNLFRSSSMGNNSTPHGGLNGSVFESLVDNLGSNTRSVIPGLYFDLPGLANDRTTKEMVRINSLILCSSELYANRDSNCLHVNSGGKDITINENKTTLSYEGDGQVEGGAAKYFVNDQSFWGFSSTGDFMDDYDYQNTRYTQGLSQTTLFQEILVWKDFNIEDECRLTETQEGVDNLKVCSSGKKKGTVYVVAGAVGASCLVAIILGILWWKGNLPGKLRRKRDGGKIACHLQQSESFMELVDETLGSKVDIKEAETMVKVALLCTNASPTLRPTMSEVVSMLEGRMAIPDTLPEPSSYTEDLRFKAMRDLRQHEQSHRFSESQTQKSTTIQTFSSSSISENNSYEISLEQKLQSSAPNHFSQI
ncbi:hypothetical protein DKX38_017299 [Salix brachista]|uniref:Uncharacterized protein n=1 Tax=Salix brachista TaxID=2182728 RepID=A0A5N5KUU2_9ROSI|nr:hypothetical protein DKX38_017299 [Salix brachista]